MPADLQELNQQIQEKSAFIRPLMQAMHRVIIGQEYLLERLLIGLLANGHLLLEGVPGLAKTLSVNTLALTMDAAFKRIQFTPDLLPADLVGTRIFNPKTLDFDIRIGPVQCNILLADEINRAPAKVQSALLEVMQERQLTIAGEKIALPDPFLVLATQNPIEQEGTYPLPEAQVDRFLMKLVVGYPTPEEEIQILDLNAEKQAATIQPLIQRETLLEARELVRNIYLDEKLKKYIVDLVFATRKETGVPEIVQYLDFGASPRASINLALCAKALAFVNGRGYVLPDDIKAIAPDVLRHRLILSFEAEAEEIFVEEIIAKLLVSVEVP